jgi:asparagine synthase (glutamine-hydrolysing)
MCGIAGIYRYRGKGEDSAIVQAMLTRLERRGPDDEGIVVADPAVLGNRRLAILDLSPSGHQPMESPDGRYLITFNGEIYNYEEVRCELGVKREAMHSRTDTEILLLAWAGGARPPPRAWWGNGRLPFSTESNGGYRWRAIASARNRSSTRKTRNR